MSSNLTIVIPVKNPPDLNSFLAHNKTILSHNKVVVIDSGGGERLEAYADKYIRKDVNIWEARQLGYEHVTTEFILNLDVDVAVPRHYLSLACIMLKKNPKLGAVSTFIGENVLANRGILDFGCSIWRTELLKKLYDYKPELLKQKVIKLGPREFVNVGFPYCECWYMWTRLLESGYKLDCICTRAVHFKKHR